VIYSSFLFLLFWDGKSPLKCGGFWPRFLPAVLKTRRCGFARYGAAHALCGSRIIRRVSDLLLAKAKKIIKMNERSFSPFVRTLID